MPDNRAETLRAENVRIVEQMKELNARSENGEFSADDQEQFDRLAAQFDKNEGERARIEELAGLEANLSTVPRSVGQRQQGSPVEPTLTKEERDAKWHDAFRDYMVNGRYAINMDHRFIVDSADNGSIAIPLKRAQSKGTTTAGGFAVPDAAMAALEENLLAFGGLLNGPVNFFQTQDGRDFPVPSVSDTGNAGTILAENTGASDVDATFSQTVLNAFKYTSGVLKVSSELLQDASFDVASWAVRAIGERLGRGLAPQLIVGDGSAEPGGLDLAASFVTAAGATAITRDDLIDLIHAVDPAYRRSPAFRLVLGDTTLSALKKLAVGTSDDRPLWQPSMREGAPATIEGVPYIVDIGVAAIGAGNRSVYAGDLSKFWVRQAGPVRLRRLDERYAEIDQVAFIGFARFDSDIIDSGTDPIKYLRHPAS